MASKQELGNEIAQLKREKRELELHNSEQATDLSRLRAEDRRRQEHNRLEAQRKRDEQQHRERREHLDHLGAGRLPLKGAKSWAFVHEQGEQPGIEVFVPLDAEELRVLQEHLQPKPTRNAFAEALSGPIVGGAAASGFIPPAWIDQFLRGPQRLIAPRFI